MGRAYLCLEPLFHSPITRHQDTQAITDYFAFGGVIAGSYLGLHKAGHLCWKRDAELLGCAHGDLLVEWIGFNHTRTRKWMQMMKCDGGFFQLTFNCCGRCRFAPAQFCVSINIRQPQRFIQPLPTADSTLVRVVDSAGAPARLPVGRARKSHLPAGMPSCVASESPSTYFPLTASIELWRGGDRELYGHASAAFSRAQS